jgi:hypothetical protein
MASLSVKSNIAQVMKQFRGMDKKIVRKATVTALNKMVKEVAVVAKRELAEKTGLKKGTVSKKITTKKAKSTDLTARLEVKGRHFNLIEFGARQVKAGVSHKGWGRRQVTKSAFIFTGKSSGKRLVGKRVKGSKNSKGREKVKALPGASAPVEYFKGRVDQILKAKIAARFNKLLATALDFQFSKALRGDKLLGRLVK